MSDLAFVPFPKIKRLFREIVVTEKLDGTNASVTITADGQMLAASRTRWINPGKDDNYGFAGWVEKNSDELHKLGEGTHFGEWWGKGIQRGYGLTEKRFSLFNTAKWSDPEIRPKCCSVVPVLFTGPTNTDYIKECLEKLQRDGSIAAPGFMDVEGVCIYHTASNHLYKYTVDDGHKEAKSE